MKTCPFDFQRFIDGWVREIAMSRCHLSEDFDPQILPSDPRFGDFQCNGIFAHAKRSGMVPRQLGERVLEALQSSDAAHLCDLSLAGAGFINFKIAVPAIENWLATYTSEEDFSDATGDLSGKTIVVDYSCPNTAKQMHVGHLRSMVIGDAIARLLDFFGADVIRDNHLGDWGTQFGILLMQLREEKISWENLSPDETLECLETVYRRGTQATQASDDAMERARAELVALQNGDPERIATWKWINAVSYASFQEIYDLAGVKFDHVLGESFYRNRVNRVYDELSQCGIAEADEGALVVFHRDHPRFDQQPFIVRKRDGASNYATTDLATVLYRREEWHCNEIIYVTDGRQRDHFQQLFLTVERWFAAKGYTLPVLKHVWFGTVCGEDGKAIKTRSGEPIRLKTLFAEAIHRAEEIVVSKDSNLAAEERVHISRAVGIGAIKYGDLLQNRTSDYMFSWDKMLSLEGNTAPYLQYAVARLHAIFRRANVDPHALGKSHKIHLQEPQEIALARKLLFYPCVLRQALADLRPHFICTYIYELAGVFSTFYNSTKVLDADQQTLFSRLSLCARTRAILRSGLNLLGINALERM
ncbi:MAG: arginine--tRNA ligase [Puniceicoccales bacterium]|nr:arginine--tRNA ligase [Puniceicoccales bacterium]